MSILVVKKADIFVPCLNVKWLYWLIRGTVVQRGTSHTHSSRAPSSIQPSFNHWPVCRTITPREQANSKCSCGTFPHSWLLRLLCSSSRDWSCRTKGSVSNHREHTLHFKLSIRREVHEVIWWLVSGTALQPDQRHERPQRALESNLWIFSSVRVENWSFFFQGATSGITSWHAALLRTTLENQTLLF